MVRVHRLFEKYLAEQTGVDEAAWHEEADRREHTLSTEEVEALAARMGDPRFDPHGSPIPTPEGDIGPARGTALATLPVGQHAVIVHVEDEPEAVYAQLVAAGLSVGTRLRMLEAGPQRIRVEAHGDEQVLAPVVAANLSIVPVPAAVPEETNLPPAFRFAFGPAGERGRHRAGVSRPAAAAAVGFGRGAGYDRQDGITESRRRPNRLPDPRRGHRPAQDPSRLDPRAMHLGNGGVPSPFGRGLG